jgi:hypothetical protein
VHIVAIFLQGALLHSILKSFLNSQSGFDKQDIQDYLNLFAFVSNPPHEMLEKVEKIINLAFQNPRSLRYRDFYGENTGFNEDDSNTMHWRIKKIYY